ncbi:ABC transporter substrate-binding protein [Dactylosporangium sucinum]|uniref:ABC transporter substrate-binding protein n=1 Tax=Dactylosporangium sucinum TaxID=1424081 RepID=A0A917SZV2_9ACTN|nr:ABC transporter substrate-binding protein [Dactylosporangium sucinum]GGM04218.1 ABC transporter substrate-binding protein [Dactylosporangium sucinum]
MTNLINRRTMLKAGAGAALGAGLFGLSACGDDGTPSSSSSGAAGTPKRGGTLRWAVAAGNATQVADPAKASGTMPLLIATNCYDTLVRADENYQLTPALATEWESTPDALTWTFKLRQGVKFHDGSPLTAQDVVYSFKRILDPALAAVGLAQIGPYLQPSGIAAVDQSTVKLTLTKPNAFIPVLVSAAGFSIVKDGTTDFKAGNGTGPFTLTGFDAAARTSLARFDGYWQDGKPYLDAVQIVVIAEDATRLQAVTSGSQDVVDNITGANTLLLKGSVEPYMLKNGGWVGLTMFGDTAPFNNQKIIQAMQYAADRKKIMSVVAPGIDIVSPDIPIPPADPFFPSGLQPRPYDPDRAKALLKEAGVSGTFGFDVYAYEGDKLDTAVSFKSTAEAGGINANVITWPHATFFTDIFKKKPAIGISVARLHVSQALPRLYGKGGDLNITHFSNPQFDELVAKATATTDQAQQKKLFGDALAMVNDTAANVIPGWEGQVYGKNRKVQGLSAANGAHMYLAGAYLA